MGKAFNQLSNVEKQVILFKRTEPPFSGKYDNFYKEGTYQCRQCNSQLFASNTKFDAQCGWPSFDQALPGKVKLILDEEGERTEVLCSSCGGHLGHLFQGENLTPTGDRYCLNSLSLKFIPNK